MLARSTSGLETTNRKKFGATFRTAHTIPVRTSNKTYGIRDPNRDLDPSNYRTGTEGGTVIEDVRQLEEQFNTAERDARSLVNGLSETLGTWHADAGSWSVAECLDHLATTNCVYLDAMRVPATNALKSGRRSGLKASPGIIGRLFVRRSNLQ